MNKGSKGHCVYNGKWESNPEYKDWICAFKEERRHDASGVIELSMCLPCRDVNKFLSSRFVKGVTHSISSRNLYSFRVFVFVMKIFTRNIESAQP